MLFDRRNVPPLDRVAYIPQCRRLVGYKSYDHHSEYKGINFQKQAHQKRNADFEKHEEMEKRLSGPLGVFDVGRPVAKIIRQASDEPQGHDEVEQQNLCCVFHAVATEGAAAVSPVVKRISAE